MSKESRAERVSHLIDRLSHLLPMQGPIGVFVHHNTLHAFEHLSFDAALKEASAVYGTEPFMTESEFRNQFNLGRITEEDLDQVLSWEPNESIVRHLLDRRALRRAVMLTGEPMASASEIRWWLNEGRPSASQRALFDVCLRLTPPPPVEELPEPLPTAAVNALLIRLSAAFLDQGISYWGMPGRSFGFLSNCRTLLSRNGMAQPFPDLGAEMRRQLTGKIPAIATIVEMMERLGVRQADEESFLQAELLDLRGWAGLFRVLETQPELAPHERIPSSLLEFTAVRLTLRAFAEPEPPVPAISPTQRQDDRRLEIAAGLFHAAQALSIFASELESMGRANIEAFRREVEAFGNFERRRIWHLAYELRHEKSVLAPIANRMKRRLPAASEARPLFQAFFCIDEREESIRRAVEEIEPRAETFGAAGFYGIAMHYSGIDDAQGVSLCPIVVKPQHAVHERAVAEHADLHERRQAFRRLWSRYAHAAIQSSRTLSLGWLSTAILGLFSIFPLLIRVLAPRRYGQLRAKLNDLFMPEPRTEVTLMRNDRQSHDLTVGLALGFTAAEKTDRVASVLGPAGLTQNFARVVFILGHGSTSLNNPHESAHDCGVCGGRRGGPNGRLFAAMANRQGVRKDLAKRGIRIPDDTWFVGGYHDTSSDQIDLFDLEDIPETHRAEVAEFRKTLDRARALSALERCRRFESADDATTPAAGLEHVEARAEHLAEPRPEYGHCTNAVAVVGRRELTRGLFLDRRFFLMSYDASRDPANDNLTQLMAAGVPVCAGISLEYYFSFVDNHRYGCGTKLPHNVTGLVGVMDGHASDLRTGLPWQMVEIHEPVRILFVIETSPERLMDAVKRLPGVELLVKNQWVRVAIVDPETRQIYVVRPWGLEPFLAPTAETPRAATSRDWYKGHRAHLPVAEIGEMAGAA